jgi:hypothetical protein
MSLTGVTNMRNLFEAMEKWLSTNRKENLVFQEDEDQPRDEPKINEETMYTGEEEPQNNWSEQEVPEHARAEILEKVTPETCRTVRRMHRGLGHPERGTMLRLMKLSGASSTAVKYAKTWQCPVCQRMSKPAKPAEASTAIRPFGFNETVGMDLKYLKDRDQNRYVALTVVDSGTAFQQATLLKSRDPKHVAEKFVDLWIAHYGCPRMVIVDQGGEFSSYFTQLLEDLGLDSKVSGAHTLPGKMHWPKGTTAS